MALKLRADVPRSPKQGHQRPHKKDMCLPKNFKKKEKSEVCTRSHPQTNFPFPRDGCTCGHAIFLRVAYFVNSMNINETFFFFQIKETDSSDEDDILYSLAPDGDADDEEDNDNDDDDEDVLYSLMPEPKLSLTKAKAKEKAKKVAVVSILCRSRQ